MGAQGVMALGGAKAWGSGGQGPWGVPRHGCREVQSLEGLRLRGGAEGY